MKSHQLDLNRAVFMDALYFASGRTCGTYTGLFQEWCHRLGVNFRDIDGAVIKADCIRAINATDSIMADKHASACMEVFCHHMMQGWEC